jgi:hypothetical protein
MHGRKNEHVYSFQIRRPTREQLCIWEYRTHYIQSSDSDIHAKFTDSPNAKSLRSWWTREQRIWVTQMRIWVTQMRIWVSQMRCWEVGRLANNFAFGELSNSRTAHLSNSNAHFARRPASQRLCIWRVVQLAERKVVISESGITLTIIQRPPSKRNGLHSGRY